MTMSSNQHVVPRNSAFVKMQPSETVRDSFVTELHSFCDGAAMTQSA